MVTALVYIYLLSVIQSWEDQVHCTRQGESVAKSAVKKLAVDRESKRNQSKDGRGAEISALEHAAKTPRDWQVRPKRDGHLHSKCYSRKYNNPDFIIVI